MVEYNRKIDVIIPAYNVPDKTLSRCLASIACQEVVDELEVTIVDDASTEENYAEVIKIFSPLMKINLLRYETNGGPGVARQYGIDHTHNEYITFIDADDTFHGAFALKMLKAGIEEHEDIVFCTSIFDEIHEHDNEFEKINFLPHNGDLIWMFGKIYKRNFIQNNNIHFHPTSRANEDAGFNRLCWFYSIKNKMNINHIQFPTYFWHENLNSITRINNYQYTFGGYERGNIFGFTENMIYVFNTIKFQNFDENIVNSWVIECMYRLYKSYIDTLNMAPEYKDYNFSLCQKFYKEVYQQIRFINKDEQLQSLFIHDIDIMFENENFYPFCQSFTINDFLNKLKES